MSGILWMSFIDFIYSTKFSQLSAIKNSLNVIGYIFKNSTLPTGNDVCDNLIPNKLPAHTIWYSFASSWKYFKLFKALGHSWISSKIINVFSGNIAFPYINANCSNILFGSFVLLNKLYKSSSWSKLKYATPS